METMETRRLFVVDYLEGSCSAHRARVVLGRSPTFHTALARQSYSTPVRVSSLSHLLSWTLARGKMLASLRRGTKARFMQWSPKYVQRSPRTKFVLPCGGGEDIPARPDVRGS